MTFWGDTVTLWIPTDRSRGRGAAKGNSIYVCKRSLLHRSLKDQAEATMRRESFSPQRAAQLENWQLVMPGGVGADGQSRAVLRIGPESGHMDISGCLLISF